MNSLEMPDLVPAGNEVWGFALLRFGLISKISRTQSCISSSSLNSQILGILRSEAKGADVIR